MADFNIMTAPISDEVDKGHVFGEVDNELVRFPATGLGGSGSGEGGSTEVPPGVVFVETDEATDPLPEEGEAEEGGLDADRLGGLTPPYFVKKSDLSDAFDPEKAYAVGDYCIYENALYRFIAAKPADEGWGWSYVLPVKLADEIGRVSPKTITVRVEGPIAVTQSSEHGLYIGYIQSVFSDNGIDQDKILSVSCINNNGAYAFVIATLVKDSNDIMRVLLRCTKSITFSFVDLFIAYYD